ncbi:MAG: DUF6304 family protein [Ferruginibacter sp.]
MAVILMTHFSTTYKDKGGQEISYFESDGSILKIELRGIQFSGASFDYLGTFLEHLEEAKNLFDLNENK